jgi:hypothetical protein
MLTPEEQKVNPFFLGGDNIYVAFPTDAMADDDKRMTLRGNNIHFSRATVHHELIPGHHTAGVLPGTQQPAPQRLLDSVLDRGVGRVLGDDPVRRRLSPRTGRPGGHAVLADAPRGQDHLLAQVPPGADDAGGGNQLPGGPGGP